MAFATIIESPLGPLHAEADAQGITVLSFDDKPIVEPASNPVLEKLRAELAEYFAGKRNDFTVAVSPPGTESKKLFWSDLVRIPPDKPFSCDAPAPRTGNPPAHRAVPQAN